MPTQQQRRTEPRRPAPLGSTMTAVREERIRARAYELYLERGRTHGHDWEDWFQAERELRGRRRRPSA
jgi:Protein of unknown function (DUF2934)